MKICHLYISPGHNYWGNPGQEPGGHPTLEVDEVECVAGSGLVGDRYFDYKENYKGQVTFFSTEVFDEVCGKLGVTRSPGVTRRNVFTKDVDLNSLIGKKFTVQGVEFEGMAECSPCHWMDAVIGPGAEAALKDRGGLRAKILTSGRLRVDK